MSVVMSAWNAGPYLEPAIQSILAQTWQDFEFIIVDDASTDGSQAVIARWAQKDSRVVNMPNATNRGASASLNRGIAAAKARWIARIDADDISQPERLARQMAVATRREDAGLITSLLDTIDTEGRPTLKACKGVCQQTELLPWFLMFYNRVGGHGQVLFRRDTFLKIGGYLESDRHSQDRDLWPRLLREGPCVVVPEVLYRWRAGNPQSVTTNLKFRYAKPSIECGQREVKRMCGVDISFDEGVLLRDFWLRFHGGGQDWDAAQRKLLELAGCFEPVRPVRNLRAKLRGKIAMGWLANAVRAVGMRDARLARAHTRRAWEAAGWSLPAAVARLAWELACVGGDFARRL